MRHTNNNDFSSALNKNNTHNGINPIKPVSAHAPAKHDNNDPQSDQNSAAQTLHQLMRATQDLIDLAKRENRALKRNDMSVFSTLQNEKEYASNRYLELSKTFRSRIDDFRGIDAKLLDCLEALQKTLSQQTKDNNIMVKDLRKAAQPRTESTLFNVQEMGQNTPSSPNTGY